MAAASANPDQLVQAHAELWNLSMSYLKTMALQCAVELGILNAIHRQHGGAASLADLLAVVPVPDLRKPYLPRLMRFLATTGVILADEAPAAGESVYRLTPLSRLLVDDDADHGNGRTSLAPLVLTRSSKYHVAAAMRLSGWFKGEVDGSAAESTPFEEAHGVDLWGAMRRDPQFNDVFNAGMGCGSRLVLDFVVTNCGEVFDGVSSLVDVGGGTGSAARAIARAFPHVKCSVLDLPNVISSIPSGDDGSTLQYVMHDWDDEDCVKILAQCKKAIRCGKPSRGGKVLVIDTVVGSPSSKDMLEAQVSYDLLMMVVTTGKERDEHEWGKIFEEAGFRHDGTKPVLGFLSIMELYPE